MTWSKLSRQARGYGAAWERIRKQVIKRDGYLCQRCIRASRITLGTDVHHIKPKAQNGSDDMLNLELVCRTCHLEADAEADGKTIEPKVRFDERGYAIGNADPRGGESAFFEKSSKDRPWVSRAVPRLKIPKARP